MVEEVVVKAQFQRNLENALDIKRNASTIVDGISADDIGSLPALDMGEALQAVPGVQINREGERRESSINLRGLPSGFVLTTANGQSVANPTRSTKPFGAPNPLGAYDPAIFNGINVIKTQTAAMHEGGIAGTVDQRLARALDRPAASLTGSVGVRNEVLADEYDPELVISGSKHIIEDVLAFTGTLAYSKQSFRRDTIKINRYDPLNEESFVDPDGTGQSFADWKAENNVPEDAIVQMPGELRQGSEVNRGDRMSFAGGVEFRPTNALTLGVNGLYTERDMDDNAYEQLELRTRYPQQEVTPLGAPRDTGELTSDGTPIYSVTGIDVDHVRYAYDNRQFNIYEQSQAVILDAEWEADDWIVDGAVSVSSSENQWDEVLLSPRFDATPPGEGGGHTGQGNGISATLITGEGDISDFVAEVRNYDRLNLDNVTWVPRETITSDGTVPTVEGPYLLMTGTWENIQRDNNAIEINAERMFNGPLSSVQFGYRFNTEEQDSDRLRNGPAGVDPTGLLTEDYLIAPSYTREEAFFGGEAPGFAGYEDGWKSFPIQPLMDQLVDSTGTVGPDPVTGEEPVRVPTTGFYQRGGQQSAGLVYNTKLDTNAVYAMANFDLDITMPVSGNFGLRYVDSQLEASAPFFGAEGGDINNPVTNTVEHDYDYLLPSMNVAMNLLEDVKLRLAYSESIVRPNLRANTPASSYTASGDPIDSVVLQLPGVKVDPFEGTSYDLSLEWYNRAGSALTFAAFRKEVDGFFGQAGICGDEAEAALESAGYDAGELSLSAGDVCVSDGSGEYAAGTEVAVSQVRNIENTITVDGFELSVQQNLDFLPYPWNGFGGVLNYSSTSQETSGDANESIPGISDDTYNVIGYYEQDSYGVRLAYNYRSEYQLESVGTFNGAGDKSVDAAGRLDLSAYYNVTDDMTLSLKGYNLTNTLYEEYETVEWQPRATHFDGRIYVLSVQYEFL